MRILKLKIDCMRLQTPHSLIFPSVVLSASSPGEANDTFGIVSHRRSDESYVLRNRVNHPRSVKMFGSLSPVSSMRNVQCPWEGGRRSYHWKVHGVSATSCTKSQEVSHSLQASVVRWPEPCAVSVLIFGDTD
ncbi:hypothetical protein K443DRAFT_475553 [Laccaria amethystina LaAM-08-1]|uniref:Uncharacterized protein n=1 Tax=Laccaria amethystina LaAM-08-1 TaxID=1095629 RepID=A0A0C9WHR0_9AGAR|nr:hypothetical protein K443DRAFT_475553 [Laccaria amethystina LaAM-08-1]